MHEELSLHVKNGKQLLTVLLDNGVFVPGAEHVAAGEKVQVRISIASETFRLKGKVLWRRIRRGPGLMRGAAVEFDGDQAAAVQRLLAIAREPHVSVGKRSNQRLPVSLRIRYHSRFSLARDLVRDLSLGGLRIFTDTPPAVGTQLVIFLRPPRALLSMRLVSEVMWVRADSFGVRFLETSPREKRRLQRLLKGMTDK